VGGEAKVSDSERSGGFISQTAHGVQDYAVRHRFPLEWPVADTSGMLLLQRYQVL
jgi:hypothetical protein